MSLEPRASVDDRRRAEAPASDPDPDPGPAAMPPAASTYRPEIDGLRALAVIPVMLFHAGFDTFSGGYVGVDIFFVISGYLITTILVAEMRRGTFTFAGFYERRARRILPALFVVLLACLPFVWAWSMPLDLQRFSASLIAVAGFVSNIHLRRSNGYFEPAAETNPLLHTWSLAIEEQYYLLFPLVLWLVLRLHRRHAIRLLAVCAVASLLLAQWGAGYSPVANFYLLPTRGWEFILGGLLALRHDGEPAVGRTTMIDQWLGAAGLALIVFAMLRFDDATPFPALPALLPTVGAALVIAAARPATWVGKLLGWRPIAGIGLISYSAYLWHQPIYAMVRQHGIAPPDPWLLAGLGTGSLGLAWLSWKYVEQPCRERNRFSRRQVFVASLAGSLAFAAVGAAGVAGRGFPGRFSDEARAVIAYAGYDYRAAYRDATCFLRTDQSYRAFAAECGAASGATTALIWGDSHAAALAPGLRSVIGGLAQFTASGCPPILGTAGRQLPNCEAINAHVLSQIARLRPATVYLHANWTAADARRRLGSLESTLARVARASPASRIVVIGPVAQWYPSLPATMVKLGIGLRAGERLDTPLRARLSTADAALAAAAAAAGVGFQSALQALCGAGSCPVTVSADSNTVEPVAWDYGHLTAAGSALLARRLVGID